MSNATSPPSGRVSLIYTDIEDSTRMTRALGDDAYRNVMRDPHCERVRQEIASHNGFEIKTIGDAFLIAFESVDNALACAVAIQHNLVQPSISTQDTDGQEWTVRVRIGVHTAEQELTPHKEPEHWDYVGNDMNFGARIESLGRGGQILVSRATQAAAASRMKYTWQEWPGRRIKSFDRPETVCELLWDGQSRGEPGTRWVPAWFAGETNRYVARPILQRAVLGAFGDFSGDDAASAETVAPTPRDETIRLVTLHGPGGMGKTRLAVQCAVQAVAFFKDGVVFVSLDGVSATVDAVAERIGRELELSAEAARPEALNRALADKELLLVLDNYESVDSDEVAEFLGNLLTTTSQLRMIVTGREALKLDDLEQIVAVDKGLRAEEAETLFINRARLKKGQTWIPAAEEQTAIDQILELTDCIPLALELTAAWTARRSLSEIANELKDSLLGSVTARPGRRSEKARRHDSLAGCVEWSWNLLSEDEQGAFARLGLFADSFTPQTARDACGIEQASVMLDRMQDGALARRSEVEGRSRYQMLSVLRAYAAKRLDENPDADTIRRNFACWYLEFANNSGGPTRSLTKAGLAALNDEWRNAIAAAQIARTSGEPEIVCSLSESLGEFLLLRGLLSEREQLNRLAVDAAAESADETMKAKTLNNLGNAFVPLGRHRDAAKLFQQSLEIYRNLQDREGEAEALNNLGVAYRSHDLQKAAECYGASLKLYEEFPDHPGRGLVLSNLGVVQQRLGEPQQAIEHYEASLTIRRKLADRLSEARTLNNLGAIHLALTSHQLARNCFADAASIFQEFGDQPSEARARCNLGISYLALSDMKHAEQELVKSLAMSRELHDPLVEAQALRHLSILCEAQRRSKAALKHAREAHAILASQGNTSTLQTLVATIKRLEAQT